MSPERAQILLPPIRFFEETLSYVAVDHDGVMANTRAMATETFNYWFRRFGVKHTPDEIREWHTIKKWVLALGYNEEYADWVEYKIWYTKEQLFMAKPMPGAVEFMKKAYGRGKKVPIFSSRFTPQHESTVLWYGIYMPFIGPENIHVSLPDDVHRKITKSWMIIRGEKTPKKVFIEDLPQHAKEILETTEASVILLSNDTTLDYYLGERLFRVSSQDGKIPDMWPVYEAFFGKRP